MQVPHSRISLHGDYFSQTNHRIQMADQFLTYLYFPPISTQDCHVIEKGASANVVASLASGAPIASSAVYGARLRKEVS